AEDGGHTVEAGGAELGIPEDLSVIMGVHVDEARGDDKAGGIDGFLGVLVDLADGNDAAVLDADVAAIAGNARAIDDRASRDLQIKHVIFSWSVLITGSHVLAVVVPGRRNGLVLFRFYTERPSKSTIVLSAPRQSRASSIDRAGDQPSMGS